MRDWMRAQARHVRETLAALRTPARSTQTLESIALLVGAAAFAVGFPLSYLLFVGRRLEISGEGSIGWYAASGGAVVTVAAFVLGRIAVRPVAPSPDEPRDGFSVPGDRLRWYDLAAVAAAYAAIALLGWLGIAELLALSFTDAPVFAFPGSLLVAVAFAVTGYVAFLASTELRPMSLSLGLAIFLVVGAFASMLTSSDAHWWQDNLSALGMTTNRSSSVFNLTLILSGIIVATIARYATAGLPVGEQQQRRGRLLVRIGLILIGLLLATVGVFPVDEFFLLHTGAAIGMAVSFGAVVIGLPWLLPTLPRVFFGLGYLYVAVILLLSAFFAVGYYNLTAVELIAAVLIFSWIIVFLRTAASAAVPAAPGTADVGDAAARARA
ncbi:putative membrane protein [Microbacterium resistens]|uniref:Membrane protein n=1 Tax=Microbacterium resistens TaxID=156977 RepID=A0ABU1S9C4_9MICO|nr:DUF998 domain-containing protein [Microbacterium resistens]MDR6866217.1 putative membrane protein [Microbacterium resistens]